ncbi:sensor histidine kinase [Segetibacter koreensis]|uniref:sensor histidine kinase n=1 Tax=Segetibacter koreensis TaxID=398037 RepID=UPI000368AEBE|nr:7TM diverse intracellular signaling domain-containing protein [Segetibacter koreensis]
MKSFYLSTNTSYGNTRFVIAFFLIVLSTLFIADVQAAPVISITDSHPTISIGNYVEEHVDKDTFSSLETVTQKKFNTVTGGTPNYNPVIKSVWLKFRAVNNSSSPSVYLNIAFSNLGRVSVYKKNNAGLSLITEGGNELPLKHTIVASPDIILNLNLPVGQEGEYLVHITSEHPIVLPASVCAYNGLADSIIFQTFIMSSYLGILGIMFLYNLFLYFSTRDNNYLYYIIYIFFLALAQLTLGGYAYRYFWPNFPSINKYAVIWTSTFATVTGILFSMIFLHTSRFFRKAHVLLKGLIGVYIAGLVLSILGYISFSYYILNFNGLLSVIVVLIVSIHLAKRGFRPAVFYLIAWLALLLSFIVLIFININLLPYNTFTAYIFYIGSAIEVALLSLALADRINILKKEKETSQAEALKISRENEKLVREQNIVLERKVAERTEELQTTNEQLSGAFKNLKGTQIQLVEAEKMASLGQLTAGIAHEINNPINFVKSNIKPLQLDFKDLVEVIDEYSKLHTLDSQEVASHLKQIESLKKSIDIDFVKDEITSLMTGIENGAERTAEIVRGLRTFSRLDESVIKTVNIHEGIDSTLILLRSNIPANITVVKEYNADGTIECYPGKLNQVFMNILSNAIHAIKAKENIGTDEKIIITTNRVVEDEIEIRIKDTGKGMSEEVKQKIYDPFFTTKDVGEGTGLGMAIVFKIIKEHSGKIEVISEEGKGCEFIITLNNIIPGKPII